MTPQRSTRQRREAPAEPDGSGSWAFPAEALTPALDRVLAQFQDQLDTIDVAIKRKDIPVIRATLDQMEQILLDLTIADVAEKKPAATAHLRILLPGEVMIQAESWCAWKNRRDLTDDVVQEAFMKLWKVIACKDKPLSLIHRETGQPSYGAFRGFVMICVRREFFRILLKEARHSTKTFDDTDPRGGRAAATASPEEELMYRHSCEKAEQDWQSVVLGHVSTKCFCSQHFPEMFGSQKRKLMRLVNKHCREDRTAAGLEK